MSALQRSYFGGGRRARRRARRAAPMQVARNPRRRSFRRRIRSARRNPTMRGYARRAREMVGRNFVGRSLLPAAVGGAGALGLDVALAVLPVPAMLKAGALNIATRVAGALALGYLGKMLVNDRFGEQAMTGALVVTFYDGFKQAMTTYAPSVPLSDYMNWNGTQPALQLGVYDDPGRSQAFADHDGSMGVYVSGDQYGN
jgi:hypothetical protein